LATAGFAENSDARTAPPFLATLTLPPNPVLLEAPIRTAWEVSFAEPEAAVVTETGEGDAAMVSSWNKLFYFSFSLDLLSIVDESR